MSRFLASDRRSSRRRTAEGGKRLRLQPILLALEDRKLLSTIVVTNPTDTPAMGEIDLRQAIVQANTNGGIETITFGGTAFDTPRTITLTGGQLELSDTTGTETITGSTAGVTVSGGGLSRVFQVDANVTASMSGLTISGGSAGYNSNGGGLLNYGTTAMTDCTVSGNEAGTSSGTAEGGGIFNSGVLSLNDSTIASNSAKGVNSLNFTTGKGGGLFNTGQVTVTGSTIVDNTAQQYRGGGGIDNSGGTVTLTNTVVALNTATAYRLPSDIVGTVSGTYNLIANGGSSGGLANGVDGNIVNVSSPGLGTLGNYGGPTQTIPLLPGSPAIDAGTSTGASSTDQRGEPRDGNVDIGAFESQGFTIAATSGGGQSSGAAFADPLVVTVTANNPIEPVAGGLVTFTPPTAGASATISGSPAVIGDDGTASVTAASNFVGGSYTVSATVIGITGAAPFSLTNSGLESIAVTTSVSNPTLAVGVSGQFSAIGTFADGSTEDLTDFVTWSSATSSVATIDSSGVALAEGQGSSVITASFDGVVSPGDTLDVIAPSFVVDTTEDSSGFYEGKTSLRQAIESANLIPDQTITFASSVFSSPETIMLSGTQLELSDTTGTETIIGPAANLTIDGQDLSRVFEVDANVTASITGLTITGGNSYGSNAYGRGGGLLNYGSLALTDCTVSANYGSNGGGLYNAYGGTATLTDCTFSDNSAESYGSGGGLLNLGVISLTDCTIGGISAQYGNSARYGGGLDNFNMATLLDCTISGNSAGTVGSAGFGGGVYNSGTIMLTGCTVGGMSAQDGNSAGYGGGLDNVFGTATLANCTVSDNSANNGGGLYNRQGTINLTECTISGNSGGGLSSTGTATLSYSTVENNTGKGGVSTSSFYSYYDSQVSTGPLSTTTLTNCTVSGNSSSGNGGGLSTGLYGLTTLINSTVSGNSAVNGGGVFTQGKSFSDGTQIIYGTTTLTNSTVSGNTASGDGAGIYNGAFGQTTLTDCTVSGNEAGYGGGVFSNYGEMTLTNCTISGNSADLFGGGLYSTGAATLINTIVAANTAPTGPDVDGPAISEGNNLIGKTDGSTGWVSSDLTGTVAQPLNALLAPLANYGGSTDTMALLPGSPAINAGTSGADIPTTDQRGEARFGAPDIGAFESQGFTITEVSGSSQSANLGAAFDKAIEVLVKANNSLEPVVGGIVRFRAPSSGASATLSSGMAMIGANGMASITAIANEIAGTYEVVASTNGAAGSDSFLLTNTVPPPVNVTPELSISFGGFVFNRKTGQFTQTITIKNTSGHAIVGPIELVLVNLQKGSLVNQSGVTQGNPYITILSSGSLAANGSLTFSLVFADPTLQAITYSAEFLAGTIPPPPVA